MRRRAEEREREREREIDQWARQMEIDFRGSEGYQRTHLKNPNKRDSQMLLPNKIIHELVSSSRSNYATCLFWV